MLIKEPKLKKKKDTDKNRYVLSQATQKEFNIKTSEIPMHMREEPSENMNFTNHVDQNIKVIKSYNDINKVVYLSKLKFSIESQMYAK